MWADYFTNWNCHAAREGPKLCYLEGEKRKDCLKVINFAQNLDLVYVCVNIHKEIQFAES